MSKLIAATRNRLPSSAFGLPKRLDCLADKVLEIAETRKEVLRRLAKRFIFSYSRADARASIYLAKRNGHQI